MLVVLCFTKTPQVQAQYVPYSSLGIKTISTKISTILDTLTVEPNSIIIEGIDSTCYTFDIFKNSITFNKNCQLPDSVIVKYRHFPINFSNKKSSEKYTFDTNFVFKIYDQEQPQWYNKSPLKYSGSYSRNMQVGNNQSMSMNSNFNMQINGYLLDSILIEGAITDNQLPFQPDGNTQQVQEFDRIYIILEKNRHRLTFGDFNLDKNDAHFLKFNKRAQGVYYQGINKTIKGTTHNYGISGSISKGQYARNQFNGIEGNQGPYKLIGNNGETFFIILAGTEKVYIDGMLLTRGEDKDYIINYNTSEIIFMPKSLITKDKRILVEFEYQDRNYLNSLIYAHDNIQVNNKLKVNLSFYSNQDAKNQPYLQELNSDQKRFLSSIGDSIQNAFYENIIEEKFSSNKILYQKKDTTLVSGIIYRNIYEYSIDSTKTLYSLGFSYVGEHKGNYIISNENANGRTYQWVAPLDGVPQGNYEPVSLLITPKMHQIYNAGIEYRIDTFKNIKLEASGSIYDPNLFSSIHNNQHFGLGIKANYSEKRNLGKQDSLGNYKFIVENNLDYEYLQHNYRAISPFRQIEFSREWNIFDDELSASHQHLGQFKTQWTKAKLGHIGYEFSFLNQERNSQAYKHYGQLRMSPGTHIIDISASILASSSSMYSSQFTKNNIAYEKRFKNLNMLKVGSRWETEHNKVQHNSNSRLSPHSFSFDTWTTYLKNDQGDHVQWDIKYILRKERIVDSLEFKLNNIGHNIESRLALINQDNHNLDINLGYRFLELLDTTRISSIHAGGSILGRINYSGNILDGFFTPNLQYEFGNGQEQKKEYIYVEVPAGQGMYYWVDYNEDGVQQANEFEIGLYPDQKRFIRILTPTNAYIGMSYYTLQGSLNLNFAKLFSKNSTGISKILSRIHNQFSIQSNNKITNNESVSFIERYIPFSKSTDSLIINKNISLINSLFFNRSSSKWGFDYSIYISDNKTLLTYGLESQSWKRHILSTRWSITPSLTTQWRFTTGNRNYFSGINDGRTYDFAHYSVAPSISYIHHQNYRLTTTFTRENKQNLVEYGGEKALLNYATAELRFSFKKLGSLQASFTYSHINFNGDDKTAVSLIMLDALKNGHNALWNFQWNTMIMKGIEMSILYEGRKPAGMPLIHTGNMTIRAIL